MNLLFFLLKLEHRSFYMETERYQGCTTFFSKRLRGGTIHCQLTNGVTDRGNIHCIKGKCGGGQKYETMSPDQALTSNFEDLRKFLMFWLSLHGYDENCV